MQCPKCQASIRRDSEFCHTCGNSLSTNSWIFKPMLVGGILGALPVIVGGVILIATDDSGYAIFFIPYLLLFILIAGVVGAILGFAVAAFRRAYRL